VRSSTDAVASAARESYGRIVATLIRITGDWNLAKDCAQEALALAVERWPVEGVPGNPGGWLMTVARNRVVDVLRRASVERRKLQDLAVLAVPPDDRPDGEEDIVDDRLRLIFTCCHPALSLEARVALTLRTVAGVPTGDIAQAFLVSEPTMTRRLTRAKNKIATAGIPYRVPTGTALAERLPGVLAVLYLLFTQGYNSVAGSASLGGRAPGTPAAPAAGEPAFADEAIRLARLLRRLMPQQPEIAGLLALFLFQHSRRDARRDADGSLLTLDQQDRGRWDHAAIAEARGLLAGLPMAGPYVLQARIAAGHAGAQSDWPTIAHWYDELVRIQPSPVIMLNRAVAHGYAYGAAAGLTLLAEARAGGALDDYLPAMAAEAELTAQYGDRMRAELLFRAAADLATSPAERKALLDRATEMAKSG
jgi:RNA polymerase sigma-70 factor, ECF subfamily